MSQRCVKTLSEIELFLERVVIKCTFQRYIEVAITMNSFIYLVNISEQI
jgi:hypothetical protein